MAIKHNSIADLKATRDKAAKGDFLVDADYILRDKKQEAKDGKAPTNTRDITAHSDIYKDKLADVKREARAEVEKELMSSDFVKELTAKIKAELEAKPVKAK